MKTMIRLIAHELRLLARSRALLLAVFVLVPAFALASWNSVHRVAQLRSAVDVATEVSQKRRAQWAEAIEMSAAGKKSPHFPAWMDVSSPVQAGLSLRVVGTLPPQPLAGLAAGESDVAPSTTKFSLSNRSSLFDHDEIVSPHSLTLGALDPAFILVFLVPLLVLALGFDLVASERERGTLRLLRAAPIRLDTLLVGKAIARGLVVAGISLVALGVSLFILVPSGSAPSPVSLLVVAASLLAYIAFWLGAVALFNTWRLPSSTLAIIAAAVWAIFTLFWPGVVRTAVSMIWPAPSRVAAVVELRTENVAIEKQTEEILSTYLRAHPELAPKSKGEWQRGYILVQEQIDERLAPTLARFTARRAAQTNGLAWANVLSPPSLFDAILTSVAGTDRARHDRFVTQATSFQSAWFARFKGLVMEQKKLTPEEVRALPEFRFEETKNLTDVVFSMSKLFFAAGFTWLVALLRARRADLDIVT